MKPASALGTAAFAVFAAHACGARADDTAVNATAQALYDRALQALDGKDYTVACPQLEEVVKLAPEGIGGRITLGECYEGAGKLASAWSAYRQAEAGAVRLGQQARAEKSRAAAAALEPRLATLTIEVPPVLRARAGLAVRRDGVDVAGPAWGVPIPVDKGSHVVSASAARALPWSTTVDVAADGAHLTVTIGDLQQPPPAAVHEEAVPASSPAVPVRRVSPLVYVGFITAGAGAVVGSVTGAITIAKGSTCKTACSASDLASAKATAWTSNIAFGVGLAGVVVGVIGVALPRKAATIGLGPTGVTFSGVF